MASMWATVSRWFGWGAASDSVGRQLTGPSSQAVSGTLSVGFDGAMQIAAVWACIDLYARTISTLPLEVFRIRNDGSRSADREARLWQLLHTQPNSRMVACEFLSALILNLQARGNGYARIDRDATGEALALWPMAADQVEPVVMPDGSMVYQYTIGPNVAILAAENVLHIKGLGNGTVGMNRLDFMRPTTSEATRATAHSDKLLANAGKPAGVLMVDRILSQEQRNSLRASFGDVATGDTSQLYVLEANMKYQQVSMSPADVQLIESRQFTVAEVGRWFGVPSALINAVDMTNHADILESWFKTSVRPLLVAIEKAVHARVLTPRQRSKYAVEFNFEALLRAASKDRFEQYGKAAQNGILTRNEIRALENRTPLAGGDDLTAQVNLVPLALLGKVKNGNDPQNAAAG